MVYLAVIPAWNVSQAIIVEVQGCFGNRSSWTGWPLERSFFEDYCIEVFCLNDRNWTLIDLGALRNGWVRPFFRMQCHSFTPSTSSLSTFGFCFESYRCRYGDELSVTCHNGCSPCSSLWNSYEPVVLAQARNLLPLRRPWWQGFTWTCFCVCGP